MKRFRKLPAIGLVLLICLSGLAGCSKQSETEAKDINQSEEVASETGSTGETSEESGEITHEPELAPSFELKTLEGDTVTLEDFKGQYVFVNFWATWCQYCDEEMPDLMAFQKAHKEEMTVLAINVKEKSDVVQKYIDENKLDLKVLMDEDGTVSELYQVSAFPTTFLIDKAGKVIGYVPGKLTAKDMESAYKYLKENDTTK